MWFLEFLKAFIGVPAFLVGLVTLIGALILRKKFSQVIISTFKVIIGFLILGGGAGVLVGSLDKFQPVFQAVYKLQGSIPNNDAFAGVLTKVPEIATLGSLIMVVALVLNIVLSLVSRLKYVYLSGHVLFYMSIMLAAVFLTLGFKVSNPGDFAVMLIGGSTLLASYMVISPALQQRYMRLITGSDEIGLGHTGGFGYALSGLIGEGIGKAFKGKVISTEEIKFPKGLYFFRNTLVSLSITILVFYMAAFLPAGILYETEKITAENNKAAFEILKDGNWVVTMFVQAFIFTAGIEIMLSGVRLFIGELIPTFKGISDKLIKNAKAAVDCPVVFPYAPNAVLIGFISSFIAGIIGMGITIGLAKASLLTIVILPGIIPHFFLGATSGVFGNVRGGILGAIAGPFVHGLIITFVPAIFIWGGWIPATNSVLQDLYVNSLDNEKTLFEVLLKSKVDGEYNFEAFEKLVAQAGITGKPADLFNEAKALGDKLNALNWGDTDYIIGVIPGLLGRINKYASLAGSLVIFFGLILDGIISFFVKKSKNNKSQKVAA
ncbi:PTS ascorbate transporter subunit IIC [Mycoplasmopsis ciconiae]|uniref:Ascorbate-specific PTS system EIIC component n=1 Tax=Mycoplasmopsis ciconiae TaxID=561067 RepID=A0ABU7MKV5_9BACT|nr:PTS ascorbate transporter subunit IIC [Mycoplasmopsis ciconiae]